MKHRFLVSGAVVTIAAALLATGVVSGQGQSNANAASSASGYTAPRTSDGQPDLQGYWTNAGYAPLERPANVNKEFFTKEEAEQYEKQFVDYEAEQTTPGTIECDDPKLGPHWLYADPTAEAMFCENDTNVRRLFGTNDARGQSVQSDCENLRRRTSRHSFLRIGRMRSRYSGREPSARPFSRPSEREVPSRAAACTAWMSSSSVQRVGVGRGLRVERSGIERLSCSSTSLRDGDGFSRAAGGAGVGAGEIRRGAVSRQGDSLHFDLQHGLDDLARLAELRGHDARGGAAGGGRPPARAGRTRRPTPRRVFARPGR